MLLDELDDVVVETVALQVELGVVFGVLTGLAVPVDPESLNLSLEFETLDFLFFSFSCFAFCLCLALLFLNQTYKIDASVILVPVVVKLVIFLRHWSYNYL